MGDEDWFYMAIVLAKSTGRGGGQDSRSGRRRGSKTSDEDLEDKTYHA